MRNDFFPPRDPPLPLDFFTQAQATSKTPFNPGPIDFMVGKYTAGLTHRPTAKQLRDWMNNEAPVPAPYNAVIQDVVGKMTGRDLMVFRQNCGASMRGFAHLIHETRAYSDIIVHYIDSWSDIGDQRPRRDRGYGGSRIGL